MSDGPPAPASSAMTAKVGAAARQSPSAAARAAERRGISMSALVVFVVAAPPDATRLVAPLGGAVEPLVHAPEAVQPARVGGIGVVDGAVVEREGAHAGPLARIRSHVGSAHGREQGFRPLAATLLTGAPRQLRLALEIILDPLALLLLRIGGGEVVVEVAAVRGRPGKRPAHPPLERLQRRERRPRHRREVTSWFARWTAK